MAEAMGIDTFRYRMVIFVIAALLACVSGWLYAHLQRFVNPTPFGMHIGIEYLFMAVVGGAATSGARWSARRDHLLKQWLQDWLPKLLGPERQLRDDRLRHPAGPGAAARPRRPVADLACAGAGQPACAHVEPTPPLPRRDMPAAAASAAGGETSASSSAAWWPTTT
jgi:hypothetical protein